MVSKIRSFMFCNQCSVTLLFLLDASYNSFKSFFTNGSSTKQHDFYSRCRPFFTSQNHAKLLKLINTLIVSSLELDYLWTIRFHLNILSFGSRLLPTSHWQPSVSLLLLRYTKYISIICSQIIYTLNISRFSFGPCQVECWDSVFSKLDYMFPYTRKNSWKLWCFSYLYCVDKNFK
jgi:hypothetical protein